MNRNVWLAPALLLITACATPLDLPDGYRDRAFATPNAPTPYAVSERPESDLPDRLADDRPLLTLTLESARALALQRNHTAAAATAAVENAIAQIAQARAAFLPTLNLNYTQTYSDTSREVDVGGGQSITVQPGQSGSGQARFALSLFAFGRDRLALDAARMNASTSALRERSARQALLFQVSQAWYRIHEADALAAVAKDALDASERQFQDANNIFEAGRVTKDQMLTARVNMLRNRQELLVAKNTTIHARRILNVLLDRTTDAQLSLSDPAPFAPVSLDKDRLVLWAKNYNPDLVAFRTQRAALELTRDSTLRSFAPELIGTLGANNQSFSGFGGVSTEYFATVGAQWNPIDGGRRIGRLQEIHAQLVQLKHQEIAAFQEIELNIQRALLDLTELESQVNVARESVIASEESYRIVQSLFQNGRSTSRELLEQELTLSQSRASLSQALYAYRIELARIESFVGVSQERFLTTESDAMPDEAESRATDRPRSPGPTKATEPAEAEGVIEEFLPGTPERER